MAKPKVLVTRRWPDAVETRLAANFDAVFNPADKPLGADDLRLAMTQFDAILPTGTDRICARILDVDRPQTRLLANFGEGFHHIDVARASAHGMTITNTPDVLSECTADLAMTLMLMVARRVGEGEHEVRSGAWTGWRPTHLMGTKVSGKTLGIIGFGRVGQEVARRAHLGFGMSVVVYDPRVIAADCLALFGAVQVSTVEDLLPRSDFVSVHVPGTPENRNLINAARLNLMKPGAFLINTARGGVVNEQALAQALWFETIAGAALDVFESEPYINPDLAECDNLVMLPHLGSATREAREAMGFRVLDNMGDFFDGRPPRNLVI